MLTLNSSFSSVAYPQPNSSIILYYIFQVGQSATIYCRVMPGKLSQYYSVRWINGSVTIATSNPHSVLPGYQLHDNFSLTINDIQLHDSNTRYQCAVTINDPQLPGIDNVVYDQLGSFTVMVYGELSTTWVMGFKGVWYLYTECSLTYIYYCKNKVVMLAQYQVGY